MPDGKERQSCRAFCGRELNLSLSDKNSLVLELEKALVHWDGPAISRLIVNMTHMVEGEVGENARQIVQILGEETLSPHANLQAFDEEQFQCLTGWIAVQASLSPSRKVSVPRKVMSRN